MPAKSVHGVAYTSIVTLDHKAFEAAVEFYTSLAFRVVKNYLKNGMVGAQISAQTRLTSGVSPDLLKELWLELFPLQTLDKNGNAVPWQNLPIYYGDGLEKINEGTILKLRLVEVNRSFEKIPLHQQMFFFLSNLDKISEILSAAGHDVAYDQKTGILTTTDPIGNPIKFINKDSLLSEESYNTSEEYIAARTQKIIETHAQLHKQSNIPNVADTLKVKKKIGIMTSGGDAPGMNAAVRAVVRTSLYLDCDVFAVYEGYTGLVTDQVKKLEWGDVRLFLSLGGTAIGTARCMEFRERAGRLTGAYNMIKNGIDALIVCGGDGSLTGADLFRAEWPLLIEELLQTGKITKEQADRYPQLTVAGLVGSIDNDMAMTDSTIGAASSLARITEMIDYIDATANSHSRAFVVEVMGRHCGWLALMAGIASGADYIFIPETPADSKNWKDDLKEVAARHRSMGSRKTTVIVAEGAIDNELKPITSETVKDVLVEMGLDTRITTLGHVQRGGTAVAHDRMLATLQGVEAVKAILESTPDTPLPMIGMLENKIVRQPLVEAVAQTKKVAEAISKKDFDGAIALRDSTFKELYASYKAISRAEDGTRLLPENERLNIGIIHVGASSLALNAATRAAALYCISRGHKLFGLYNGFHGLIQTGKLKELKWLDVWNWHNRGGSELGTNRLLPSEDFGLVAFYLQKYSLNGLLVIGGFEAFTAAEELLTHRHQYPIFNIPTVVIPATVLNNVPGTEYSLGTDTCLNQLVDYCDAVKQSASSSRRRVFVVEVQGGHSGFVALYAGLVTGSIATYTPEDTINLHSLQEDIKLLTQVFANDRGEDRNGKMIIRNEQASLVYSTQLIADILKELSKGRFETRTAIPGHVQQGFTPSATDRVHAARFLVKLIQFIEEFNKKHCSLQIYGLKVHEVAAKNVDSAFVIGVQGGQVKFSSVEDLYQNETNVTLRKGKTIHWKELAEAANMLSGRLSLRQQ